MPNAKWDDQNKKWVLRKIHLSLDTPILLARVRREALLVKQITATSNER